jgi:hypothetical protein
VGTPSWTPKRAWAFFYTEEATNKAKVHTLHHDASRRYDFDADEQVVLFEPGLHAKYDNIPHQGAGQGIGLLLFCLAGSLGYARIAVHSVTCGIAFTIVIKFFANLNDQTVFLTDPTTSIVMLVASLMESVLLIFVIYYKHNRVLLLHAACLCDVSIVIIRSSMVWTPRIGPIPGVDDLIPFDAIVIWFAMVIAYLSRVLAGQRAAQLVKDDIVIYDDLWRSEVEKDTGHISIKHLEEVKYTPFRTPTHPPTHTHTHIYNISVCMYVCMYNVCMYIYIYARFPLYQPHPPYFDQAS